MPSVQFGRVATQQVVIHLLLRLSSSAMCNGVAMQCVVMSVCVCMCCIARADLMCPPEISNRWPSSSKLTSFASGAAAGISILQSFDRVAASGVGNSIMNLNLRWKAVSTCAYLFVIATTITSKLLHMVQ